MFQKTAGRAKGKGEGSGVRGKGRRRARLSSLTPSPSLDGDDFDVGVNLLFDKTFDAHQRACQRTGATAAGALIAYGQRVAFERDHVEPAAVGGEVGAYLLVEHLVDAQQPRVVAHHRAQRAADAPALRR